MRVTERHCRRTHRWLIIAAGLWLLLLAAAACGGGEGQERVQFRQVTASDRVYAIDDFVAIGFKRDKQYDVAELPAGLDAWLGFWGPDPYSRKDYELRFYASHEDAVEHGTALAEEVTGEDAELYRKNPTWEEGAKDRWQSAIGFSGATSSNVPSGQSPKYGGYAIFANVVMLCQGAELGQSLERCEALVKALTEADAE